MTYTLTLFSPRKPAKPDEIFCSTDMMSYGLWTEISKLGNVQIQYVSAEDNAANIPECDFALIHCCFDGMIFKRLKELRAKVRYKIILVMEFEYGGQDSELIDHSFTYLKRLNPTTEQIQLPCYKSFLNISLTPKIQGSILLDHQWTISPINEDMSDLFYEWLAPLPNHVAQLRRPECETIEIPNWVQPIEVTNYPGYLAQTAIYETFIVTHRGSYEHSIIDMVARGTQVLVPIKNNRTYCHPSIVEDLNLSTFSNREELFVLLEHPKTQLPSVTKFTDMTDIAMKIDKYCQAVLVSSQPWNQ